MLKILEKTPFTVSAKLVKRVKFSRKGEQIRFSPGLIFILDTDTNIGLLEGFHVQLDDNDYVIINQQ